MAKENEMEYVRIIDKNKIKHATELMLEAIGVSDSELIFKETPERVSDMCLEVFEGMKYSNDDIAKMFGKCFAFEGNTTLIEKDIPIFSFCEHHLALMYNMRVHVAYKPCGKIIGLSKISRIADMVGKRIQLQERINDDIAYILEKVLDCNDVMVVVEGEHSCVSSRGIKKIGAKTITMTCKGVFENDEIKQTTLELIGGYK